MRWRIEKEVVEGKGKTIVNNSYPWMNLAEFFLYFDHII